MTGETGVRWLWSTKGEPFQIPSKIDEDPLEDELAEEDSSENEHSEETSSVKTDEQAQQQPEVSFVDHSSGTLVNSNRINSRRRCRSSGCELNLSEAGTIDRRTSYRIMLKQQLRTRGNGQSDRVSFLVQNLELRSSFDELAQQLPAPTHQSKPRSGRRLGTRISWSPNSTIADDGKQAENVVNANTNADVLASELESVRKADVLKSARSRFAEAASAATPETVTLRPKSTREIHYATRMSYNGPPRRAVSMHNLATEFSLANEESKPDVVLSSESYVADELELLRSRAVARQSIGKFAEPVEDSFTSSVTSRPADIECPVGTVKKLAKSSFAINELGLDDGRDKPTQNFTDDLPSNGLARKMAARFQIADENPEAEGEPDSAAV